MGQRLIIGIILVGTFLGPMLGPWVEAARSPDCFSAWAEADRILSLIFQSLQLFLLTSLIALPWGAALAIAVERGRVRHRRGLRAAMLFAVVLPIPVVALSWQAGLANLIPKLSLAPGEVVWQPWQRGLLPAAWIHAMVGLPWVFAIVSIALRRTDRLVEDEARLTGGNVLVWKAVLVPRILRATLAAAAWLAVQTGTEITVTDMMMVRTFAEETYTQLVIGGPGIHNSLALVLPIQMAAAALVCLLAWRVRGDRSLTAGESPNNQEPSCGNPWPTLFAVVTLLVVLGVPLAALIQKSGSWNQIITVLRTDGRCLAISTAAALATGWATATAARRCCWVARSSPAFRIALAAMCIALATSPGPVLGFGLKSFIGALVEWEAGLVSWEFPPIRSLLYDQPSAVPSSWAAALRLFPLACLLLWPAIKQIPGDLIDLARVDGANLWTRVVAPATGETFHAATFMIAALAMGEVAAAKVANPPFFSVYILRLFDQMHYGSESSVAALALVQWFLSGILGVLWWITRTSSDKAGRVSSRSPA